MNSQLEKQLKILSAITRIHQSVGANLELQEIYQIIIEELILITKCDGCATLIIEKNNIIIAAEKGFTKILGNQELSTDITAFRDIITLRQGIFHNNIIESPFVNWFPQGCSMNSIICSPIVIEDQVIGLILLAAAAKNVFSIDDCQFVELLAKEISVILKRSLNYNEIKGLSLRDGLTGCFNRRAFEQDLKVLIDYALRYNENFSLLLLDIDWFKVYNDYHGHQQGDILLKQFVHVLQCNIRSSDKIYRYGGEEFAVLLPKTDKNAALKVAQKLQKVIELEKFYGEEISQPNKKITLSIGLAILSGEAKTKEDLIRAADCALYKAKGSGRNKVCSYN